MTHPVSLVCAVMAAAFLLVSPVCAAPSAKVVSTDAVPGLSDYLTRRFQPGWSKNQHVFLVRVLDLDEMPDGIDEILLSVDPFDPDYCDNTGCPHEVLVRQPAGSLKAVTSFRGFGLKVADTYTSGVRDLISETSKGNRRFNLAGETSGTRGPEKPGAKMKDVRCGSNMTRIVQKERAPLCSEARPVSCNRSDY